MQASCASSWLNPTLQIVPHNPSSRISRQPAKSARVDVLFTSRRFPGSYDIMLFLNGYNDSVAAMWVASYILHVDYRVRNHRTY